jgi:hypothetical protein
MPAEPDDTGDLTIASRLGLDVADVTPAVRRAARLAAAVGLDLEELCALLRWRSSLLGGRCLYELLEEREDLVCAQIRLRGRVPDVTAHLARRPSG